MILFRALSRFRALFDGDGPSALNRGTTVVINFSKNCVFQKIIGGPKFGSKINFVLGLFVSFLQGLEVQNKSNTMRTPLWPLGKEFRRF